MFIDLDSALTRFPSPATAQAAPEELRPFSKPNGLAGISHHRTNVVDPDLIPDESTEHCKVGYDRLQAYSCESVNAYLAHFPALVGFWLHHRKFMW